MKYVALLSGNVVNNVVVADDNDDIAAFPALFNCDSAVDVSNADPRPGPGWTLTDNKWRPPQPFPSWSWVDGRWTPPVPYPDDDGDWVWDEATQSWVERSQLV